MTEFVNKKNYRYERKFQIDGLSTNDVEVFVKNNKGFYNIQGHLWHAIRALGFDFKRIVNAVKNLDSTAVSLNS